MSEFITPGTKFAPLPSPFLFKRGGQITHGQMAYETWGKLNAKGDNVILILSGLSPNAHAASSSDNPENG